MLLNAVKFDHVNIYYVVWKRKEFPIQNRLSANILKLVDCMVFRNGRKSKQIERIYYMTI